jgi:release factor glutamine methyltransferase
MDPDESVDRTDTVVWRRLLAETEAAVGDPTHARWICETAASATPDEFRSMLGDPATARMVAHLDSLVARARSGEPIQYVLGSWQFRHVDLTIDRRVLIPRPETEDVAGTAIHLAKQFGPIRTVADLGTGSGAIGLAMAQELPLVGTTVWISDASNEALDVARANIAGLGRHGANVRAAAGSWLEALPRVPAFDVIVSNPPYVATGSEEIDRIVSDWEPSEALFAGADGLDDIRIIVSDAFGHLRPGGWLVIEHGHDQGDDVEALMTAAGFDAVEIRLDLAGLDRMAVGRRPLTLLDVPYPSGDLRLRHLANTDSDAARMLKWLTTTDVLEWYEGRDQVFDLARILATYGPGGDVERDELIAAIIELDGDPIGYAQLYELDDPADAAEFELDSASTGDPRGGTGIWSIDLFVGEPEMFGRGIGRAVCRSAAEFMLNEFEAREVVIMPYVENARAIAAYRAAGFVGEHVVREHELHEGALRDGLRLHFRPT